MTETAAKPTGSALDPLLIGALVALAALGAIMVGSASVAIAEQRNYEPLHYFTEHLAALGAGTVALAVAAVLPTELWFRLHWLFLLAAFALLALVLVPGLGVEVNGSSRWLQLGPMRLQASEPARLCLMIYVASFAVRHARELASSFMGFFKPMLVAGIAAGLLLVEPDFGAAVVLLATTLGVLFVGGARLRDFLGVAAVGGVALVAIAFSSAYRVERLTTFLDPWADPLDSGFQLTQSLIAIGRGEWFGVGLGASVQKLFYLPEAHTDFVFAVLAEELGFAGGTLVVLLFAAIVYRALVLGRKAMQMGMPFQALVATGVGVMIGLEAFINIGVNSGLLPTKGLTLPLVSYGRSSTIVTLAALGLLLRIHRELAAGDAPRPRRQAAR